MTIKVVKFGGSSLADSLQVGKAIAIVKADPTRTHVVVSAPGKRNALDTKVTDLLLGWYRLKKQGVYEEAAQLWTAICNRYFEIISGLDLGLDLRDDFAAIQDAQEAGASEDFIASRGEYLMAKIMADALDYEFVDAAKCVRFNSIKTASGHLATHDRLYNEGLTHSLVYSLMHDKRVVMPGFYGTLLDGKTIQIFPRNSSDISGAIVAAALQANVYEKFTDVPGILAADNRLVKNPRSITSATYRELGELAIDPSGVFHPEAMYPVQTAGVETHILDANNPREKGTVIYPDIRAPSLTPGTVIGIAARAGFSIITVYKVAMNREVGFVRRVLEVLEHERISFEHAPMGRDIMNVLLETSQLKDKEDYIVNRLISFCFADEVKIEDSLALISTVGRAMRDTAGVAARLFTALANHGISNRIIDQGATEMNIVVGVKESDLKPAVNAIYKEFFPSA
ncbi:hypothetical protein A3F55_01970 [Candidatus Adlerbacteria bacterium RIFCSPHIGHO2_12_FULL_53_18]|uniref:aspartate kinase n=1 Tax=Candidatus Adlerbacteria bacterium RIFCSPHIGHO2_12_FULL_53_18 TaxID=1797242 RepID=A0A1F4XS04_9BACT|nr:MAG: hypothetical protein A3F55_01970 [Candidatus Adlerbacteria bacterium RIFCSPHIGHO2_12_FULL_53_18]